MNKLGTWGALALLITLPTACEQPEPASAKAEPREVRAQPVAKPVEAVAEPVAVPAVEPAADPLPLPAFVLARLTHEGPVTALAWSANGAVIATASTDGKLRIWDANSHALTRTIDGPPGPGAHVVAITSDGATAVTNAEQGALVFDVTTGNLGHTLAHTGLVSAVGISNDASTIASGGVDGLRIWNADGRERQHVEQGGAAVVSLRFDADGSTIASGWGDRRVRLIDAATGELIRTIKPGSNLASNVASNVAYSDNGELVAARIATTQFGIFSAATGKRTATIPLAHPLGFGAGGNLLLAAGASEEGEFVISIVDVLSSGIVRGFVGHTGEVTDAMFSPDSATFATASMDHTVLIWVAP